MTSTSLQSNARERVKLNGKLPSSFAQSTRKDYNMCLPRKQLSMHSIAIFVALLLPSYIFTEIPDVTIDLENDGASEITSPNYPGNYGWNADKLWEIVAPVGYRIRLHFTDFSTESGDDFVIIYDGLSGSFDEASERVRFSGNPVPLNITSIITYMWIRFTSDWFYQYKGFRALVSAVVTPVLTLTAGKHNISSPNYPENYDNNVDIMWQVTAPSGFRVMVKFIDFKLDRGSSSRNGDSLTVYHGMTDSFSEARRRAFLSGSSLPDNIPSIGAYIWIQFRTDNSVMRTGFSLLLSAVEPDWACDFQVGTCGLSDNPESWSLETFNNYYYIDAVAVVATFTIPHVFRSSEGVLSFGHYHDYLTYPDSLNVTVCQSQDALSYEMSTFRNVAYEYIMYSCNGTQDIEITFTATSNQQSALIRVLDIQLFERAVPSTASASTNSMETTPLQTTTPDYEPSEVSSQSTGMLGGFNSTVVPAVSSFIVLLVICLVLIVVFVHMRKRSQTSQMTDPVDQDDDDPSVYNNPVYISKEDELSTPDILVGINSTDGSSLSRPPHWTPDVDDQYEDFDVDSKSVGKGEQSAQDNASNLDPLQKEALKSSPYYIVQYPSTRKANNKSQHEEEDCTYENTCGPQSSKDSQKITSGRKRTDCKNQELKKSPSPVKRHSSKNDLQRRAPIRCKTGPSDGTAVLDDDEEYNKLTFNKSSDITRAPKKPRACGVNVNDGYGVLDLPEDQTSFLSPSSPELHNDNEYISLNEPPEEHHNGKQEGEGSTPYTKADMTDQPDVESEYYNYQDPNNMDQGSSYLRQPREPETFSSDPDNILDSGKRVGDYHGYHETDDGDVNDGYYVNMDSKVSGKDEYSAIDQDQIHKSNEAGVADFEPIYSDEVYSEFN